MFFFTTIHRSMMNVVIIPFMIPELCPFMLEAGEGDIRVQWTHCSILNTKVKCIYIM